MAAVSFTTPATSLKYQDSFKAVIPLRLENISIVGSSLVAIRNVLELSKQLSMSVLVIELFLF